MEETKRYYSWKILLELKKRHYSEPTEKKIIQAITSKNTEALKEATAKKIIEAIADCKTEEEALSVVEKIV